MTVDEDEIKEDVRLPYIDTKDAFDTDIKEDDLQDWLDGDVPF